MSSVDDAPAASRMVFVDDTDPNIQYNGFDWHLQTYTTANDTSFSSLPLYGTLHFTQPLGSNTTVVYSYQGTTMAAKFVTTDLTKVICTLDGQPQEVSALDTLGGGQCTSNAAIQDGTHKLIVGLDGSGTTSQPLSLFFDGLLYTPSSEATNTGDVFIISGDPSLSLGIISQTTEWHWDFEFVGYSMSLYINYNSELSVIQTNGSYTVDGQGPYNFTTADPLFASTAPQILIQSPRYALGQHKFHLDYTHEGEIIPFSFYGITVQNTTLTVDQGLEVIPSTTTSSSSSLAPTSVSQSKNSKQPQPQPQHPTIHIPVIVGTVIAVVVVLSIISAAWFILRRRRARALRSNEEEDIDDILPTMEPFHRRSIFDPNLREKPLPTNPNQEQSPFMNATGNPNNSESNVSVPIPATGPSQVRVVVHEDSGQVVVQPDAAPEEEIVELPPNYTSLWRRVTGARGTDSSNLPTTVGVGRTSADSSSSEKVLTEAETKGRRVVFNRD